MLNNCIGYSNFSYFIISTTSLYLLDTLHLAWTIQFVVRTDRKLLALNIIYMVLTLLVIFTSGHLLIMHLYFKCKGISTLTYIMYNREMDEQKKMLKANKINLVEYKKMEC